MCLSRACEKGTEGFTRELCEILNLILEFEVACLESFDVKLVAFVAARIIS